MTPDVSRAVALIKTELGLAPGPTLDELIEMARRARTVDDLPQWARNVLTALDAPGEADRMVDDDLGAIIITPPPGQ